MRYIDELNAFNDWLETNEISTSAICLWYALMQIANKTGWKKKFNVANRVLTTKTGGMSIPAIHRARNALQEAGLITFKTHNGKQSTEYQIIPFALQNVKLNDQVTEQLTDQVTDQVTDHIPRLDKTRLDKTRSSSSPTPSSSPQKKEAAAADEKNKEVLSLYANNMHPIASIIEKDKLVDLIEEHGANYVKLAIEQAVMRNARNLAYVSKVLAAWQAKGYNLERLNGNANNKKEAGKEKSEEYKAFLERRKQHKAKQKGG